MLTRLGARLWNINPLWLIGGVVAAQLGVFSKAHFEELRTTYGHLVQFVQLHPALWLPLTAITVMGLAYLQNTAYGLQSRSANRNSNAYHVLAALAASFTFFWSLRLLVRNELPPALLAPYVFATILGTLHANTLSIRIESALGLSAEGAKGRPQLMKLWPTVALLSAALGAQMMLSAPSFGRGLLAALLLLTVVESFAFSLLRVARSTDHYWFHAGAVVFQIGVAFLKLFIMISNRFDWALFLPVTTGSIIGSLIGANVGQDLGKKLKATFDAHVTAGAKVQWPVAQLQALAFILVVHVLVFGFAGWKPALLLLAVSAWQAVSFTMVSRARQRNSPQYLAWTSVFSNGVWYLCMHSLAQGTITAEKAAPYIVGNAGGSLIGQNLAMKTEQLSGAVMDEKPKTVKAVAVTA
ncbi:MAG: hypothetical protein IT405_00540 [Candidatus Yanofskybacteria bacterium]|nr:hypothetical protein [Candidatus Yanofskybacteria bacterium]